MSSDVRVRFAPSPTGYLHVGGARTALFNYLFARHQGGKFLLRIEDTDRKRFQEDALTEIFKSLEWLGLDWDEGPQRGGSYGPYLQSERLSVYHQHVQRLLDEQKAYYCFCTEERLTRLRAEQERNKMQEGLGYDRHCRQLTAAEIDQKLKENTPHVIRLKIPLQGEVHFHDLIRGDIVYKCELLDDLVLLKSDRYPTYHLANVVDDHLMKISHVLRGDEWIASTPRHIILYRAFDWTPPIFAHMPVILSKDGGKLSKRKGAASVMDYKKAGFLPEALINFLALLGWAPGDDREIMDRKSLIDSFSLEKVSPKASVFDEAKLEWMNGHYIRECKSESLLKEIQGLWQEKGFISEDLIFPTHYLIQVIDLLKERSKKITDLADQAVYFFKDPQEYDEKASRKVFKAEAIDWLKTLSAKLNTLADFSMGSIESVFRELSEQWTISAGKLIHPTRLAVSGLDFGPGLFELLAVLGKETVIRRLLTAADWIEKHQGGTESNE